MKRPEKGNRWLNETLEQRFERYTIPEPNSGCLLWFGSTDKKGYGQLRLTTGLKFASHIALELVGRPVPRGKCALHSCDNPGCVNADHLFVDTQIANIQDMHKKGRANLCGLSFGRYSKIDPLKKHQAKRLFDDGYSATEIGRLIGMSKEGVHGWMKEWGHIARPQNQRTHCPQGHPYDGDNLYIAPRGDRMCRTCMKARRVNRKSRARNAAA
jgi:Putative ATPase subunit of terminase (gpP-like)